MKPEVDAWFRKGGRLCQVLHVTRMATSAGRGPPVVVYREYFGRQPVLVCTLSDWRAAKPAPREIDERLWQCVDPCCQHLYRGGACPRCGRKRSSLTVCVTQ